MKNFFNINNDLKGLILMLLGQLSFSINDAIVKYSVKLSSNDFTILNIIFIRSIFTSILVFSVMIFFTKLDISKTFKNKKSYLRGIFEVLTAIFFFAALVLMPMANVYTLLMTAPFIITIYAAIFLKETVGIRRWTAVIIGFIGVIIVINPQSLEFGFFFVLPLIAAIFLTMRDVLTKGFVNKNNILEITLITSLLIMLISGLGAIIFNIKINVSYIFYIFISSLFLTIAYICSVLTIFYAPLSLTAAIRYTVIIFGIVIGYIILGEVPSYNMIIGALIITASGLFVIKRQKDLGKID